MVQGLHTLNAWQEQMGSVLPGVEYADCSTAVLRDGKVSGCCCCCCCYACSCEG